MRLNLRHPLTSTTRRSPDVAEATKQEQTKHSPGRDEAMAKEVPRVALELPMSSEEEACDAVAVAVLASPRVPLSIARARVPSSSSSSCLSPQSPRDPSAWTATETPLDLAELLANPNGRATTPPPLQRRRAGDLPTLHRSLDTPSTTTTTATTATTSTAQPPSRPQASLPIASPRSQILLSEVLSASEQHVAVDSCESASVDIDSLAESKRMTARIYQHLQALHAYELKLYCCCERFIIIIL
jgi:hypothetical protein